MGNEIRERGGREREREGEGEKGREREGAGEKEETKMCVKKVGLVKNFQF